jgi:putative ABC transport system permease protein
VGIISWAMTLFLMGLVFAMIVNERQRELGLLRALGATRKKLIRLN